MVDGAIKKTNHITREEALKKVVKQNTSKRPVMVVSWDPRLPPLDVIQQKHYRAMTSLDPYLKEVFLEPPLVAFKKTKEYTRAINTRKVTIALHQQT